MAYDSVRAQLDKLLGPDRNGPLTAASTTPTDYRHPQICKHYLLGFCPNDLHIKHRSEPGSCRRRHSDTAKAAFERDVVSFKAHHEKARWTVALLSDCRAILMDEDRKIRCHARRLKETYNAPGDLAGLMIQTFDTLKRLGMVSKNAKIRVLSEMDDDEGVIVHEPVEGTEQDVDSSLRNRNLQSESDNLISRVESGRRNDSPRSSDKRDRLQVNRIHNRPDESACSGSDEASDEGNGTDDDDEDDFGLIKVIPAVNKTSKNTSKPENLSLQSTGVPCLEARDSHKPSAVTTPEKAKLKEEANKPDAEIDGAAILRDRPASDQILSVEKAFGAESVEGRTQTVQLGANPCEAIGCDDGAIKKKSATDQKTAREVVERSKVESFNGSAPSDSAKNAQDVDDSTKSGPSIMDQCYERGVGPDGLLMLDRKQSLRVCACCGGYISLVDAESRLLSHYGGKSHHSLAQLRKKVGELEAERSAEPVSMNESSRLHLRDRSEERDRRWSFRDDERRRSREGYGRPPERRYDRYRGRKGGGYVETRKGTSRRDDRGFGTSEWYNNFVGENEDSPRHRDERSNFDTSQSAWHSSGRKRYRSRSPNRNFRRPRRHD